MVSTCDCLEGHITLGVLLSVTSIVLLWVITILAFHPPSVRVLILVVVSPAFPHPTSTRSTFSPPPPDSNTAHSASATL